MGTIVVLDSDRLFRDCLIKAIRAESGHTVVGGTADFAKLHRLADARAPDFAIITLVTHDVIEVEQIAKLRQISPRTRLILLSRGIPPSRLKELVKLGAKGYINRRGGDFRRLIQAIDEAAQDRLDIDSTLITPEQLFGAVPDDGNELTPRELSILPMLVQGYSNREIASALTIGVETVKTHVSNICRKVGARSRKEVPAKAVRLGLISADNL